MLRALSTPIEIYNKKSLADIDNAHLVKVLEVPTMYTRSLDSLMTAAQKGGELEMLLAVKKEKQRFGKSKTVPSPPTKTLPQAIQNIQIAFHKALADLGAENTPISPLHTSQAS